VGDWYGHLTLGGGTYLNDGSTLICTGYLSIGRDCAIAWGVTIMATDTHVLIVEGEPRDKIGNVVIGDHVWIRAGATVMKGITVADGAIVAAAASRHGTSKLARSRSAIRTCT
jgi:acetyltransferase-like isoleucine patch superfamily enzyme